MTSTDTKETFTKQLNQQIAHAVIVVITVPVWCVWMLWTCAVACWSICEKECR